MKNVFSALALVLSLGLATVALDAEAGKRVGSGKSVGTQRQMAPDKPAAAPATAATAAPAAGAAAAAAPKRSWMGPLAGLAAGLGLAALASHLGFGGELASMLMMGLLAVAVIGVVGFFMRKRAAGQVPMPGSLQGAGAAPGGMQYAPIGGQNSNAHRDTHNAPQGPAYKVSMPPAATGGSLIGSALEQTQSRIPADFDTVAFSRNAKVNFIRLQAANDAGNLEDIRQFTTPEMFAELKLELSDRGAQPQKTDVLSIDAKVIDVEEGVNNYLVSVRFTGVIRDEMDKTDDTFDEVWHLSKPRQGDAGWVLAGIQQSV